MEPPEPSALAETIDRVATEFILEWLSGVSGVQIARFGPVVATAAPGAPEIEFMNTIRCIMPARLELLRSALAWYEEHAVRPWVEVAGDPTSVLEKLGLQRVGSLTALASQVPAVAGATRDVAVDRIWSDQIDVFARILAVGHGIPAATLDAAVRDTRHWADVPHWRLYLASVDGKPAGAAALSIEGEIGYLANASTVPAWRGHGVQTALIERRIRDALAQGCRGIVAIARPDSGSRRNLERAGLRPAGIRTTWRAAAKLVAVSALGRP